MKKLIASMLALCAIVGVAVADVTVTNMGQVITIKTMTGDTTAGNDWEQSDLNAAGRMGYIAATYDVAEHGGTVGTHEFSVTVPKGAIILENGAIEVSTAVLPPESSVEVKVGSVPLYAATLGLTTGVKGLSNSIPAIVTADAKVAVTVGVSNLTAGNFTVLLPIMWGNAQ